jgi:hypothetical protein
MIKHIVVPIGRLVTVIPSDYQRAMTKTLMHGSVGDNRQDIILQCTVSDIKVFTVA